MEKEVLGYYLTSHPLAQFQEKLESFCSHTTANIAELRDKHEVILGGMMSAIKLAHTKNGKPNAPTKYANFDLEDMAGNIRCIIWPDDFEVFGHMVVADAVVAARGRLDRRGGGDEANLIVNELIPISDLDDRYTTGITIKLDPLVNGEEVFGKVREIVRGYPGTQALKFLLRTEEAIVHLRAKSGVEVNPELRTRLEDLLGAGSYRLETDAPKPKAPEPRRRPVQV